MPVGAARSRFHRSQRDAQTLGDLGVGHPVEMLHAHDRRLRRTGALRSRSALAMTRRAPRGPAARSTIAWWSASTASSALVGRRDSRRPTSIAACRAIVASHGPRSRSPVEPVGRLPRSHERLLRRLLGEIVTPENAAGRSRRRGARSRDTTRRTAPRGTPPKARRGAPRAEVLGLERSRFIISCRVVSLHGYHKGSQ